MGRKKLNPEEVYTPEKALAFRLACEKEMLDLLEKRADSYGKRARARYEAGKLLYEAGHTDKLLGCLTELVCATGRSIKEMVAGQGEPDTKVKVRFPSGRVDYVTAEVKTNGGRVAYLYKKKRSRLTVYYLAAMNSTIPHGRKVNPVICSTAVFQAVLESVNAIKNSGGNHSEPAIQVSNKLFYEALLTMLEYDPDKTYDWQELFGGEA